MITFVIPSLNRESLKYTIESLLNQTSSNWRAIVVYDNVDGIEFLDKRIKTIKIDKKGKIDGHGLGGLVRNEAIKIVETEWIGFLDDDDTINKNYVKVLEDKYLDYDFVVWRMKFKDGLVLPPTNMNVLLQNYVGISFCYKKSMFSDIFFLENSNSEDYNFLKQLLNRSQKYKITPEIMYNVRH
jgi:glycosyltransferase involved in cell wall biosynthesis